MGKRAYKNRDAVVAYAKTVDRFTTCDVSIATGLPTQAVRLVLQALRKQNIMVETGEVRVVDRNACPIWSINRGEDRPMQLRDPSSFTSIFEIIEHLGDEEGFTPKPPRAPVSHPAGSREKILAMQRRLENGEEIFHPLDDSSVTWKPLDGHRVISKC